MKQGKDDRQGSSLTAETEKQSGTIEQQANRLSAILEKTGIPENIYIDTIVPYEPWEKGDIEKTFAKIIQGTDESN